MSIRRSFQVQKTSSATGSSGGPKLLKLKNFNLPKALPAQFEDVQWGNLQQAVQAIFAQQPVSHTQESLYRAVETMCGHGMGKTLNQRLRAEVAAHLGKILGNIPRGAPVPAFLSHIAATWQQFCNQLVLIRSIFLYLNQAYLLQTSAEDTIWDMGLKLFRQHILSDAEIHKRCVDGILHTIRQERDGDVVDRAQLKLLLKMLSAASLYNSSFQKPFLTVTEGFYAAEGIEQLQHSDVPKYLRHVDGRLKEERMRTHHYLQEATGRLLLNVVEDCLLKRHLAAIIEKGLDGLLDGRRQDDLSLMFQLFSRVDGLSHLRDGFASFIKRRGLEIVKDPTRDKTMVEDLLGFKLALDKILVSSFAGEESFSIALKDSFAKFINQRHNKPAELIAKFVDSKLRVGYKELSENELEELMDRLLVLFRFIHGKDVFEAFYKTHLAKRLLLQKSASVDAERAMLSKLKQECGSAFTSKLEGMFKDVNISDELTRSFRQAAKTQSKIGSSIELTANVLTASYWPTYPPVTANLPPEMGQVQEVFKAFYCAQHPHRRLHWQNSLGHCLVQALFPLGKKDLQVSVFQTVVLMLFNGAKVLPFSDIASATGIETAELKRTLQSLACGKVRVLLKAPKGKEVDNTDKFAVNEKFSSSHKRIKINQIQMKETAEENAATTERVFLDRGFVIDAAIVRIMKTRKKLRHNLLITELYEQLKFPCKPTDLKKRIESLIDREYLERDSNDSQTYNYLA
eukprot:m.75917 g.75917  ORF g.75917 m.75917 type:complete len:741 (-) comp14498_c0_seq1:51-2273(-)